MGPQFSQSLKYFENALCHLIFCLAYIQARSSSYAYVDSTVHIPFFNIKNGVGGGSWPILEI